MCLCILCLSGNRKLAVETYPKCVFSPAARQHAVVVSCITLLRYANLAYMLLCYAVAVYDGPFMKVKWWYASAVLLPSPITLDHTYQWFLFNIECVTHWQFYWAFPVSEDKSHHCLSWIWTVLTLWIAANTITSDEWNAFIVLKHVFYDYKKDWFASTVKKGASKSTDWMITFGHSPAKGFSFSMYIQCLCCGVWKKGCYLLISGFERKALKVTVHLFLWRPFFAIATKESIKDYVLFRKIMCEFESIV